MLEKAVGWAVLQSLGCLDSQESKGSTSIMVCVCPALFLLQTASSAPRSIPPAPTIHPALSDGMEGAGREGHNPTSIHKQNRSGLLRRHQES